MVSKINLEKSGGSNSGFESTPLTEGVQEARIVRVIDLGIQERKPHNGEAKPPIGMLTVMFEMADDKITIKNKDGKEEILPAFAFKPINVIGGERANLTKLAVAAGLGGKSLNLSDLIGKAVSLDIVNNEYNGKIYSNVKSVNGLSERVAKTVPELVADSYFFDFDAPDIEVAQKLSKKMKAKIANALNYKGSKVEALFNKLELDTTKKETTSDLVQGDII